MLGGQFALAAPNVSLFTPATTVITEGLNFGDQDVGTTRAAAPMRITNTGDSLLLVRGLKVDGDFAIAADGCSAAPVAPGAVCTLGVTFTPTAAGARAGTVTFRANTTTSPHSAAVSGTGIARARRGPAPDPDTPPDALSGASADADAARERAARSSASCRRRSRSRSRPAGRRRG